MPNTGSPLRVSPISEPQAGMPEMNDLVPSIGSSTQTYSASARSLPYSSPTMPCSGKSALDQRAHRGLGRAVGRRHRIEARRRTLVLDAERGAEERQDRFARHGRELVDEGGEIDGGHEAMFSGLVAVGLSGERAGRQPALLPCGTIAVCQGTSPGEGRNAGIGSMHSQPGHRRSRGVIVLVGDAWRRSIWSASSCAIRSASSRRISRPRSA